MIVFLYFLNVPCILSTFKAGPVIGLRVDPKEGSQPETLEFLKAHTIFKVI